MRSILVGVVAFVLAVAVFAQSASRAADHAPAADHGHEEHIGTANAGPGLERPDEVRSDLALFTFVVFLVLLAILWKFAWGPIIAALEKREAEVANNILQAERNREEAKALLQQYEQKLAAAQLEVRELMEQARRDAERTKQEILAEAKAGAEAERVRALRDIDAAADAAMESLARRGAELSVELAGKILKTKLTDADQAQLIQEAMARFPTTAPSAQLVV